MSITCSLFGITPRAMTAQFSNSKGRMTRSCSNDHGRSGTKKTSAGAPKRFTFSNTVRVAQEFSHDAAGGAKAHV